MKTFTYSQCNNEFVLSIKKEYKQHDNDSSIKAKYNSLCTICWFGRNTITRASATNCWN